MDASGGVACYIRDEIAHRFELWRTSSPGSILWLRSKDKFEQSGKEHNLFIGLVYIPPKGSSSESRAGDLPAYDVLQQDIADVIAHDGMAIIAGDFNARTASAAGTCQDDYSDILDPSLQPPAESASLLPARQSADQNICAFGRSLLGICETSDLCILNGRTPGDTTGKYTCHTAQGSSVVDYFLTTSQLRTAVSSMTVGDRLAESDHCTLTLQLMLQAASKDLPQNTAIPAPPSVTVEKIRYNASKTEQYRDALHPLLFSVFSPSQPHMCLATALQSCIVHAALATFGRPSRQPLKR